MKRKKSSRLQFASRKIKFHQYLVLLIILVTTGSGAWFVYQLFYPGNTNGQIPVIKTYGWPIREAGKSSGEKNDYLSYGWDELQKFQVVEKFLPPCAPVSITEEPPVTAEPSISAPKTSSSGKSDEPETSKQPVADQDLPSATKTSHPEASSQIAEKAENLKVPAEKTSPTKPLTEKKEVFNVQVGGVFSSLTEAENTLQKAQSAGLNILSIQRCRVKGKPFYRVIVKKDLSMAEVKMLYKTARQKGISCTVFKKSTGPH